VRQEVKSTLEDQLALPVKRDDVVAVVEHNSLHRSAEIVLQEANIAQAGAIVLARTSEYWTA
jgi:hypothetical protein